jgi:uncharacterized protein (TIGR00299 family) protein
VKTGYFDCFAGASGDMILASLFDVGLSETDLADDLAVLGIKRIDIEVADVMRNGIRAKSFSFGPEEDPPQRTYKDIVTMIESSGLSARVKQKSIAAFDVLGDAEGRIHGIAKQDIHFHEVGSLDSIVDIVGSFAAIERLGLERIVSSPLALGSGSVRCEHGLLPVPAPATLDIARGLPVRGWAVPGELTTPTGAAILRTAASDFGPVPHMSVARVGYGAGKRVLEEIPNVLRLIVGEERALESDRVTLIETNIDDMNPEFFTHIFDDLFAQGALDVWVQTILMKKGRPGFLLSVLGDGSQVARLVDCILSGTTTSGVRLRELDRVKLPRQMVEVETRFGKVRVKVFDLGTSKRGAPEYEDCLRISREQGIAISDVIEEARNAYRQSRGDPA